MLEIMEQAMDIALDKKDLERKRARRLARKSRSASLHAAPMTGSAVRSGLSERCESRTRSGIGLVTASSTPPSMAK